MTARCAGGSSRRLPAALATLASFALLALAACGTGTPSSHLTATESVGPNGPISWSEAQTRIGEEVTAEGPVTSVEQSGGDVLLNLGADAPDPSRLVVVIPKSAADAFPADAESAYLDQLVRVTGTVEDRDGVATIVADKPSDLSTGE